MAKLSSIEKNSRRQRMIKSQAPKRAKLKAIVMDKDLPVEDRFAAQVKLSEMPRNGAKVRYRNRCELTGRARSVYRKFKLGRVIFRDLASSGQIPGVIKASW